MKKKPKKPMNLDPLKGFLFAYKTIFQVSKSYAITYTATSLIEAISNPISTLINAWVIRLLTESYGLGAGASIFLYIIIAMFINLFLFKAIYTVQIIGFTKIRAIQESKITFHLKSLLFDKMTDIDLRQFNDPEFNNETGIAMDKTGSVINAFKNGFYFINNAVNLIGNTLILTMIAWWLPIIVFVCLVPSMFLAISYEKVRKKHDDEVRRLSRRAWHANSVLFNNEFVEESKIYDYRHYFKDIWAANMDDFYLQRRKLTTKRSLLDILSGALFALGSMLSVAVAVFRTLNGYIGVEMIAVAVNIISDTYYSMDYFNTYIYYYMEDFNNVARIMKFLDNKETAEVSGTKSLDETINIIRFDNVWFSYKNDETYAIKNINMTINTGEYIAFAGLNGSGKTTIIKLLCGIYTPTKGTIYYNDIPHTDLIRKDIQSHFSTLYQEYARYALTIGENITLSEADEVNTEKLNYILEQSGADDVITDCEGLDTKLQPDILDNARDLSVGQWQKVATARSMYHTTQYIIMDEPSSAIDPLAERDIYNAVKSFTDFNTKFIISHRLSYMQDTTRIILLDKGEIIEDGSFDDLKRNDGVFKYLYDIQADRYNIKNEEVALNG